MVQITFDLVKKKAEHHDGLIVDLQELSLHQLRIKKIENIGNICPKLRILYLQNNVIGKIENLKRMKSLVYLNLALNNVTEISGLEACEKLQKLDLTVNFVDVDVLDASLVRLQQNEELRDMYLTGNPCVKAFPDYRPLVIAMLPSLVNLDGTEITKSERLSALPRLDEMRAALRVLAKAKAKEKQKEEFIRQFEEKNSAAPNLEQVADGVTIDKTEYGYTPELRMQMALEEEKEEAEKKAAAEESERKSQPEDPVKEAKKKLNVFETVGPNGEIPRQRNVSRVDFTLKQDDFGNIVCDVDLPRYMDTSLLNVDVHPTWFQCLIKGQSLLLHLPDEVNPDKSKIQRHPNGHLILTMPIASGVKSSKKPEAIEAEMEKKKRQQQAVAVDNTGMTKLTEKPNARLKAKRAREAHEQELKDAYALAAAATAKKEAEEEARRAARKVEEVIDPADYDFDLDEVPPLD